MIIYEKTMYTIKHITVFSIFGALATIYISFLPLIYLSNFGNREKFIASNQRNIHIGFKFIILYCRALKFIDMQSVDEEKKAQTKGLLISNHLTFFDIVLYLGSIPNCHVLASKKYFKNPLLGPVMKSCGYIPLERGKLDSQLNTLEKIKKLLSEDKTVLIFPEGTRSEKQGYLAPFHNGVFYLAWQLKVAIQPLFLTTNQHFFCKENTYSFQSKKTILKAYLMPPIPFYEESNKRKFISNQNKKARELYLEWMKSSKALAWNHIKKEPA